MPFIKATTRYKLNKFISSQPASVIKYAADVKMPDKDEIFTALEQMLLDNSITIVVMEHHTPKGFL
jgi:hypothetical protein|tara:strand:+ start:44 stop:241 length:198 start_codon:yes stop_codon:yes gene_type:complete